MSNKINNLELRKISAIFLVDEAVDHDLRVLASQKGYKDIKLINCRSLHLTYKHTSFSVYINVLYTLIVAFIRGFWLLNNLKPFYGLNLNSFGNGLHISLKSLIRAHKVAEELRLKTEGFDIIHAHDLFCGVIGTELAKSNGARLIYDAHEVEFYRNRQNSWLRLLFDWAVEKRVIKSAHEIRVVNTPIADLYRLVYPGIDRRLRVVSNNHFESHPIKAEIFSNIKNTTIVYVGQGTRGRQLEQLASISKDEKISVHAFFIGHIPAFVLKAGWVIGSREYEKKLISLVKIKRCMMWCCVDNTSLSYRLSLPNKFFQALAVGMPVIVAKDTYLSEIVDKYKIGMVFDGHNFNQIHNLMKSKMFIIWVKNVLSLRHDLSKGLIVL